MHRTGEQQLLRECWQIKKYYQASENPNMCIEFALWEATELQLHAPSFGTP
jgi:hypothetical protein